MPIQSTDMERPHGREQVRHISRVASELFRRLVQPSYYEGVRNLYNSIEVNYPEPHPQDTAWYDNPSLAVWQARANTEAQAGLTAALGQGAANAAMQQEHAYRPTEAGADAPSWQSYLDAQEPDMQQSAPPVYAPPVHMSEQEITAAAERGVAEFENMLNGGVPPLPQEQIHG